jgi:uncharacterized protein YbaR (Trm112 family)
MLCPKLVMLCPSCKLEGKYTIMQKSIVLNHPEKLVMICPKDRKHWEVIDRIPRRGDCVKGIN